MSKNVLLFNDLPGYGKVALAAAMPILSRMGYHVYNLPTALVSNTLDWGKFEILETTGYIASSLHVWEELGFSFDTVVTGFLASEHQAEFLADVCRKLRGNGSKIIVDPIMGDAGRLYNSVTEEKILQMKKLTQNADYILPNYTEAACLAGVPYSKAGVTKEEAASICDKLIETGAGAVVITSICVDGKTAVAAYGSDRKLFVYPFEEVPVRFAGTGDIFAALFAGEITAGKSLEESVQAALGTIGTMIQKYMELPEAYKGIPVEMMF